MSMSIMYQLSSVYSFQKVALGMSISDLVFFFLHIIYCKHAFSKEEYIIGLLSVLRFPQQVIFAGRDAKDRLYNM